MVFFNELFSTDRKVLTSRYANIKNAFKIRLKYLNAHAEY